MFILFITRGKEFTHLNFCSLYTQGYLMKNIIF